MTYCNNNRTIWPNLCLCLYINKKGDWLSHITPSSKLKCCLPNLIYDLYHFVVMWWGGRQREYSLQVLSQKKHFPRFEQEAQQAKSRVHFLCFAGLGTNNNGCPYYCCSHKLHTHRCCCCCSRFTLRETLKTELKITLVTPGHFQDFFWEGAYHDCSLAFLKSCTKIKQWIKREKDKSHKL